MGGVLGPENMPDANAGGGDSTYTKESNTSNNAVNETTTASHIKTAAPTAAPGPRRRYNRDMLLPSSRKRDRSLLISRRASKQNQRRAVTAGPRRWGRGASLDHRLGVAQGAVH